MRRTLALLLTLSLLAPGCASTLSSQRRPGQQPDAPGPDRVMLTTYLMQLPVGSRVRATLLGGKTIRGTLMQATDQGIVVQQRTRIPEPPTDIPIAAISAVEIDTPGGAGKIVGIGVASGAGGALGLMLLLIALFSGD